MEDFVKVGAVNQVGGTAKKLDRRLFTKRALGTQDGYALWGLKRQTGRHDFTPDRSDVFVLERTRIGLGDFVDDLRHPVWSEKRRAFRALDVAHFLRHFGAGIQYTQ